MLVCFFLVLLISLDILCDCRSDGVDETKGKTVREPKVLRVQICVAIECATMEITYCFYWIF